MIEYEYLDAGSADLDGWSGWYEVRRDEVRGLRGGVCGGCRGKK